MTAGCICQRAARRWGANGVCATCGQRVIEEQITPVVLANLTGGTGLTLWRNPVGFDERSKNHYGLVKGAADYIGLWAPAGRFVAVEMKRPSGGRHEADQKVFRALVQRLGGVYALVRSEADARALLQRLRAEGEHQTTTPTT